MDRFRQAEHLALRQLLLNVAPTIHSLAQRGSMLREKIQSETVTAMKAKDKDRTAALRLIGAKIKDRDIELRTAEKKPEDDEMVTDVLLKMAKQRRESIEMYESGGRTELAEKEKAELAVIEEFLPKQMSEEETRAAIAAIKHELGAEGMKDMGRVMGELKARHGATLDMSQASGLVKEALS
jgi:uncharacterized protein